MDREEKCRQVIRTTHKGTGKARPSEPQGTHLLSRESTVLITLLRSAGKMTWDTRLQARNERRWLVSLMEARI